MKLLVVSDEPRYKSIVAELRKNHEVDYVFRSAAFKIENGDYHIPIFLDIHKIFLFLVFVVTNLLLLIKRYDVCLADYKSVFMPMVFSIIKKHTNIIKTNFVYDIRTIPVDYDDSRSEIVEKRFARKVRFANRFYQGIAVITEEMKKYIQNRYVRFDKPVGVWESGVDPGKFRPLPPNMSLKRRLGFKDDDFICFYHGSLSDKRGVIELVESFQFIKFCENSIKLLILGSGMSYNKLQEITKIFRLEDTVQYKGWVDRNKVSDFISIADLCIVPLPDIDWWRVSSPLKLMEYIACGKNILLTDIIAHINVVGTTDNYFWIREVTPESFAESIINIFKIYKKNSVHYYDRGMIEKNRLISKISWETRAKSLTKYLMELDIAKEN